MSISDEREGTDAPTTLNGPWATLNEARAILGFSLSNNTRENPIVRGVLRCGWGDHTGVSRATRLVFVEDLQFLRRFLAENPQATLKDCPDLVSRGVFPAVCAGMSGDDLVLWARSQGRSDLLEPHRKDHEKRVPELARRVAELEARLERTTALTCALYSAQGKEPQFADLTPLDCQNLVRQALTALSFQGWTSPQISTWTRLLGRLELDHLRQLCEWAHRDPEGYAQSCRGASVAPPPDTQPYGILYRMATRLSIEAQALAYAEIRGGQPAALRRQALQTAQRIEWMCAQQAALELMLRPHVSAPIPVPLSPTDRYLINRICRTRPA